MLKDNKIGGLSAFKMFSSLLPLHGKDVTTCILNSCLFSNMFFSIL